VFNNFDSILNNRCAVFSHTTNKIQTAASKRIVIAGLLLMTGAVNCCTVGFAQGNLKSSGLHSGRLHSGRITRSFTEPVEQSVAASGETGIVAISSVKEGDFVKVGAPINGSPGRRAITIGIAYLAGRGSAVSSLRRTHQSI